MAYLYQKVLDLDGCQDFAASLPAVPDSAADLKAKLAAIDAVQKPPEMLDQTWGEYRAAEKAMLKDTWRNRDAVRALEAGEDRAFHEAKLVTARFYGERVLPRAGSLRREIEGGAEAILTLPVEAF